MKIAKMSVPLVATILLSLWGCDPEGKKDCAWELEPDSSYIDKVEAGFVPLCARNRTTMKQDCRLQAKLDFAKAAKGRKFRYDDLKVDRFGLPRTIKTIEYCQ